MYSNYVNANQNSNSKIDEAVGLLQHLSKDELQSLLDDNSKLEDLIRDATRNALSEKDTLIASNKSLAEYNLGLQPRLDELKRKVATGYEDINTLKNDLGKNKAQLDSMIGEQSLDTTLALLQTEAAKSEEDSEQLATDFCDNKGTVEEFVSTFTSMRTVAHTRRVKVDKMTELLRDMHAQNHPTLHRQQNPPQTQTPSWGVPPAAGMGTRQGQVPYPTGNSFKMPQPHGPYGY